MLEALLDALLAYLPRYQTPTIQLFDDEAFDDADKLFTDAFDLPDPAPELLKLIKAHPTERAIRDLLIYYELAAEANPYRANALVSALVALRDSEDAPTTIHDSYSGDLTFAMELHVKLVDLHSRYLDIDKNNTTFCPTNSYLVNCLLSALSLKHNLASSHFQYYDITLGLEAPSDSSICELFVIGACIQLITIGSKIVREQDMFKYSADDVATKLKSQQGKVKDTNARRLVELTISHAESGFKEEGDVDNVWELLFPPQHED